MVLMARSMAKKTLISRISENSDASNASTHVRWCRMFFLAMVLPMRTGVAFRSAHGAEVRCGASVRLTSFPTHRWLEVILPHGIFASIASMY